MADETLAKASIVDNAAILKTSLVDSQTLVKSSMQDVFNKADATSVATYFSPELHDLVSQGIQDSKTAFPDLQYTITNMASDGDTVAFTYTAKGTQKGVLEGLAATNKAATWSGSAIATVSAGKITHIYVQEDYIAKMAQLGHITAISSMTGKWVGSTSGITVSLTLTQSGNNVTGSCTITGFSGTHAVTGTNTYPSVKLSSNLGNGLVGNFDGEFSGPNTVSGSLTIMGSSLHVTINRQ
jgi:predicted ester cyclase